MGAAVAHGDKHIIFLKPDHGTENLLSADGGFRPGIFPVFAVAQYYHLGIVILDQLRGLVVYQTDDGKSGISHAPHRAYRQRGGNSFHAFLDGQSGGKHGGNDFAGQGGQDAGFNTAAQPVRQHDHAGGIPLLHYFHMIPAELFSRMINAFVADITG